MGAYEQVRNWVIIAFVVLLLVRAQDVKFGWTRCVACGARGQHKVGCPGRRGY